MKVNKQTGVAMLMAVVVGFISGCQSTGMKRADDLASNIDKACKSLESANVAVSNTLVTLNSLQLEETDLTETYSDLKKNVKQVSSAVERIKKGNEKINQAGTAKYDAWKTELDTIQNEDIKKESMKRMEDSLEEYEDLMILLKETDTTLDPLVADLSDIVKYLELDLTQDGVKKLSGGIRNANKSGKKVEKWLGDVVEELALFK